MSDGTIDLGNEPPLSLGNQPQEAPARRAISTRWLGGTILTGVTSIFLMGGALVAALDNPDQFASLPEALAELSSSEENAFGQKSDRIQPVEEEIATRQILQVSTVTRQGERDFIKLRPFAKVLATLGAPKEEFAAQIPPYDVMRIFADTSSVEPSGTAIASAPDGQISDTTVDGEVSVKVTTLQLGDPALATVALDTGMVEQVVRAAAKFGGGGDMKMAAMAYADEENAYGGDGDLLGGGAGAEGVVEGEDPFSALGVRIVPENVSSVAKSDAGTAEEPLQEKIISVTDNEDLETVLVDNNLAEEDAAEIEAALQQLTDVKNLRPGNKVRIAYTLDPLDGVTEMPVRVSIYEEGAHQATVARADSSGFVRADEPNSVPEALQVVEQKDTPGGMPKLYDAVYQTALEQEVPPPLVEQLIKIFAFDVDFQSRASPGDTLEVFHSLPDPNDRDAAEPEILYASLKVNGATKRFYRFRTSDDGYVDYYDEEGKSAKKFLMRKPLPGARISSNFGYRRHPILRRSLLHTGVDYGGRGYGAPILAAGNGIVEKAGRASGYGNLIVLRHTNGYETFYGHQQGFAKGIVPGARVRQGQVIGYVGSTGQSTGPHLHFEIRINGKPVDPLRIRLPEGRVLEADLLNSFENERTRIDSLLGNQPTPTTVASAQ